MIDRVLSLAFLGMKVFPVWPEDTWVGDTLHEAKSPRTKNGHLDASSDKTKIQHWWGTPGWENSVPGVATGASGIVVLDVDVKDGRDGWNSIEEAGLEVPQSLEYQTKNGGTHVLYRAPVGFAYNGTRNHKTPDGIVLDGVDRRSGSSFIVYWGEDIPWDLHLADAPEWLLTPTALVTGSAFNGTVLDWLDSLPQGNADAKVLEELARVPLEDFGHDEMITRQASMIRLAAEGHPGVREALELLRSEWLRDEYNTDANKKSFDIALIGGIRKFGAFEDIPEPQRDRAVEIIESLTDPDAQELIWGKVPERKALITALLDKFEDEDIAAVIWHNPDMSADLDLPALYGLISDIRNGRPEFGEHEGTYSLVTDAERQRLDCQWNFIDHYTYVMNIGSPWDNSVYHRMMAWNLLSVAFSDRAFVNVGRGMNINLYTMSFGPSGSGKTHAMESAIAFLEAAGIWDEVDVGSDATGEALQTRLLNRDGKSSWFHVDEGKRLLSKMKPDRSGIPQGTLEGTLTQLYGGNVEMKLRMGDAQNSGKRAKSYLTVWIGGPSTSLIELLSPEQVSNGFVARFMTAWGAENTLDEDTIRTMFMDDMEQEQGSNRYIRALAAEYEEVYKKVQAKRRFVIKPTEAAATRMDQARVRTLELLRTHPQFDFFKPAMIRFLEGLWKAAALNACMTNGGNAITLDDVLVALKSGEEWLTNLVRLMEGIHSSEFSRMVEEAFKLIKSNSKISQAALYRELYLRRSIDQRTIDTLTDNLKAQDRVKNEKGVWIATG